MNVDDYGVNALQMHLAAMQVTANLSILTQACGMPYEEWFEFKVFVHRSKDGSFFSTSPTLVKTENAT